MEGYCSTGQNPQWAVVPVEEEEEDIYTHTRTHRRIPLNERSSPRSGRYVHHTQETNIHAFNGFRTRNPRSRTTAELRRR
jgi:hypothetical protein